MNLPGTQKNPPGCFGHLPGFLNPVLLWHTYIQLTIQLIKQTVCTTKPREMSSGCHGKPNGIVICCHANCLSKSVRGCIPYAAVFTVYCTLHQLHFCCTMLCISAAYAVMQCLSVRLSVCLSRSWIMSKRINVSSRFFHHRVATLF